MTATPVDHIAAIVGSFRELGTIVGVNQSAVSHWKTRYAGHIPTQYNAALVLWAEKNGVPHRRIARHLDDHRCRHCGARLIPGTMQARGTNGAKR